MTSYFVQFVQKLGPMYRSAGKVKGTQSLLRMMAARSQWALEELEHIIGIVSKIYTLAAFLGSLLLVPVGVVTYLVVRTMQNIYLNLLAYRYPHLEFVRTTSLRTAIDTHRNQGIISLLLEVKGTFDIDEIKNKLEENVLDRKDADGRLTYPHLKTSLTTRWGRYAWEKPPTGFHIDNHLTVGSSVFRGRPVTELNIQEYVSDIVTKYLPSEVPQWQLTIIPCNAQFYMLIRIHHLLLSEDRVGLGDLLLLKHGKPYLGDGVLDEDDENFLNLAPLPYRSLINLHRPLTSLPRLYHQLLGYLQATRADLRLSPARLLRALSPPGLVRLAWWSSVRLTIKTPLSLFRECLALCSDDPTAYRGTFVEWFYRYWPSVVCAVKEGWYYWGVIYTGPRILLEELILSHRLPKHQLQRVSLCGRKVVAWSDPVPLDLVRKIHEATGISQSEILTNATAGALREYFRQFGLTVPDKVLTTARFFPEETLLATSRTFETGVTPSTGGGSLCLALPTSNVQSSDSLAGLQSTSRLLKQTCLKQPILYIASLWQLEKGLMTKILPTVVVRLILNYLTRRYAVSLTEVARNYSSGSKRQLLWGQTVENYIYWRPPQANICLSLTIMSYADSVRLGVMSDALLSPQHSVLASCFLQQLNELALAAGVQRTPPHSPGATRFTEQPRTF